MIFFFFFFIFFLLVSAIFSSFMDAGRTFISENMLPYGYRFHPTSFEVLQYYLVPKLRGEGLPSDYIKDLDVYQYDPDQLPLNESKYAREDEAYYFVPTRRELLQGDDNLTRTTPNGYWKILKENDPLYGPNGAIGHKNKLKFYSGRIPDGVGTNWKMVEYKTNFRINGNLESDLMVCKVRRKVEVAEIYEEEDEDEEEDEGTHGEGDGGTNGEADNNNAL